MSIFINYVSFKPRSPSFSTLFPSESSPLRPFGSSSPSRFCWDNFCPYLSICPKSSCPPWHCSKESSLPKTQPSSSEIAYHSKCLSAAIISLACSCCAHSALASCLAGLNYHRWEACGASWILPNFWKVWWGEYVGCGVGCVVGCR